MAEDIQDLLLGKVFLLVADGHGRLLGFLGGEDCVEENGGVVLCGGKKEKKSDDLLY
jgi:hypothetical protein